MARKVGRFSAKRCDELLEIALKEYPASADLMTAAAEIYASDKGLSALKWQVPEKNRSTFLKEWQMGIIQSSARAIAALMVSSAAGRRKSRRQTEREDYRRWKTILNIFGT